MPEDLLDKSLTYDIERQGDVTTVKCHGRLIAGLTEAFYLDVKETVPVSKTLVLDLEDIKYVDSMGLGVLVRLYVHTRGTGCELKIMHLGTQLRNLLKMTNLLSTFSSMEDHGITVA